MTKHRVIVADPPWPYRDKLPGPKRGAAKHYATMSIPEIRAFLLATSAPGTDRPLAESFAADATLFLWVVSAMLEEGLGVVREWGFVPKSQLVWVKTRRCRRCVGDGWYHDRAHRVVVCEKCEGRGRTVNMGMGRTVRNSHETCIIAHRDPKRGGRRPRRLDAGIRSVFEAPIRRHSQKPEAFFTIVERMYRGPYLELFARKRRPGWITMGDELWSI